LRKISGTASYPSPAASRSLISFFLTLSDPKSHFFLKTTEVRKAIQFFEPGFRWNPRVLSAEELRHVESIAKRVYDRLVEEGWNPVDLIDVQGFFWVATYWGEEEPKTTPEGEPAPPTDKPVINTMTEPHNQILYGPPGTGKTFSTVNKALRILDPDFLANNSSDRRALRRRFEEFCDQGRIGTVTFHQSFSYEDFVEGLRASTDDDGTIRYEIEPGIFKRMCDAARGTAGSAVQAFAPGQVFGRDYRVRDVTPDVLRLTKPNGSKLSFDMELLNELAGLVRSRTITIKDIAEKQVFEKADVQLEKYLIHGYANILPELIDQLTKSSGNTQPHADSSQGPWVLIIDEINRGNIANIFGELITLIESSKREGATEQTAVTLPYSKDRFCVPANLYIVGTMNTADRSLVHLDTALRRRFVFEPMMPNTKVLSSQGIEEIDGIDIVTMLEVMNQRIELLYDREHTLGHSFFLPLADDPTLSCLADIFQRQILPLLEEYFFEDWSKIRQVLGDHQKTDESTCFVVPLHTEASVQALLSADVPQDLLTRAYKRNEMAFLNPTSYRLIYEKDEA
jgi:5-methylcytosine-specific restriction enzyme B